ncbi:MAG: hypothetical protein ACPIOQ_59785, partial [Promethearchaeia archaeon]
MRAFPQRPMQERAKSDRDRQARDGRRSRRTMRGWCACGSAVCAPSPHLWYGLVVSHPVPVASVCGAAWLPPKRQSKLECGRGGAEAQIDKSMIA